ncbi:cell wall-active antibiotics response protein LiaF [Paenibacillus hexagrammi]|uniref:Cell wall-active antibiotics response protein LiaF n=1 Tax=Paenibacillus hexagrammi TaxID=2908839 RepID=A0ABY3SKG5_9BACL|nr:cell wall-active antibiotics response protein LiaF [Paenibacillus sp. YPD9-1]UJF34544.1 cell wall-active antibiotics response protein LiaF [Paenibacillus sp. YPD9-1]
MNPHLFQRVMWGLVLVTAGVIFLLDQTGLIKIDIGYIFSTYWPAILIFYGLMGLGMYRRHHRGGALWSLMLCAVGVIFLLRNLGLTDLSLAQMFQYLWPVALILAGLNVMFRPSHREGAKDWRSNQEARREEREARRAARHAERDKYMHDWGRSKWNQEEKPISGEASVGGKRELSEEEKAVLQDIHGGEYDPKLHHEGWDMPQSKMKTKYDQYAKSFDSGNVLHRHGFIGDVHLGQEPWELRPIQISHFIGDSVIDLTRASIPIGETPIYVNAFIGDVKIFIPNDIDLEVRVIASSFIGDMKVLDRRESGFMRSVRTQTSQYEEAERKLIVTTSMFIGDITIKKIG